MIWLFLDSYHDRRTGFEFGVNPSGVKLDAQIYNDGNEDFAWDAVWDVATRVDSLGWTAEFRIPLSQLPYGRQRSHTFGFTVDRDLYRYSQRVSWPQFRQSQAGLCRSSARSTAWRISRRRGSSKQHPISSRRTCLRSATTP